ncbi:hypothetical protein RHRU231_860116 [Rhodococcus ruber]|uniref:Uncharacterized protein n=1 Tax=Rhodococcus ruber TaxID=1830 RepID=A0A098BU41_9NOCA|nr:hypothetical protein RHRU231_860116 [Rhodococcus ruber]
MACSTRGGLEAEHAEQCAQLRGGLVEFGLRIGCRDDAPAAPREGTPAVGAEFGAADRHQPVPVAVRVAPPHRSAVEATVALRAADRGERGLGGSAGHGRGRVQRRGQGQDVRPGIAQGAGDRGGQVPHVARCGQHGRAGDLQVTAERGQAGADPLDDEGVLGEVLRRGEQLAARLPVGVRVGAPRGGAGERTARDGVAATADQQLGRRTDQGVTAVPLAGGAQIHRVDVRGGVAFGHPGREGERVDRGVRDERDRAGGDDLVEFAAAEPVAQCRDPRDVLLRRRGLRGDPRRGQAGQGVRRLPRRAGHLGGFGLGQRGRTLGIERQRAHDQVGLTAAQREGGLGDVGEPAARPGGVHGAIGAGEQETVHGGSTISSPACGSRRG